MYNCRINIYIYLYIFVYIYNDIHTVFLLLVPGSSDFPKLASIFLPRASFVWFSNNITPSFFVYQGANTCGSQGQLGHQRWHMIGLFLIKCNHLAFLGDMKLGVLPTLWWANPRLIKIIRKGKECMNTSK